ncbi:MAG: PIG-L family deacetylase, partial [Lachnospiraceae bacterium]|nr:PIG-L family deacetylase [Lachnospiraceae bacterium]
MKIAVISPHPDDETLGAGGFLLKHRKEGNQIYWINMTDVNENQGWDSSFIKFRKRQIEQI